MLILLVKEESNIVIFDVSFGGPKIIETVYSSFSTLISNQGKLETYIIIHYFGCAIVKFHRGTRFTVYSESWSRADLFFYIMSIHQYV